VEESRTATKILCGKTRREPSFSTKLASHVEQGSGSNEHPLKRAGSSNKVPPLDACRFFAHVPAAVGLCMYMSFSLSSGWQPGAKVLCVGMERVSCTWRLSYAA